MQIQTDGRHLVLSGDFDARSTDRVRAVVYELLEDGDDDLVVDLTDVDSVDLTALRVLAVATRQAARSGRPGRCLQLRGCNGAVRRLLHRSHLIRVVHLERAAPVPV